MDKLHELPDTNNLDVMRLAGLDLLLTDAFLLHASHMAAGKVHPETLDPEMYDRSKRLNISRAVLKGFNLHAYFQQARWDHATFPF